MDTKLCRICGKLSENNVQIFKIEGLKNKIETCLPIIVSPHSLLPDTICSECMENVSNFYSFIKNCLQNIIVLESQYDIMESCLKTKRKHEKGCLANLNNVKFDKNIQTDEDFMEVLSQKKEQVNVNAIELEKISVALQNADDILNGRKLREEEEVSRLQPVVSLVSYDMETEDECDWENLLKTQRQTDNLIDEINVRKNLKRSCDTILPHRTKIFKMDTSNRRKNRRPKKVPRNENDFQSCTFNNLEDIYQRMEKDSFGEGGHFLSFGDPASAATHVYDVHRFDMTQISSTEPVTDRKKKIPNLVKIADLKTKNEADYGKDLFEEPPTLQPTFVCSICPAVVTNRTDLFAHFKNKHPIEVSLMCGLCMQVSTTYAHLTSHVVTCKEQHTINSRFICKICSYHDDNAKVMENHVGVHEFVIDFCKKQLKMYDPSEYIEMNPKIEHKLLFCSECENKGFLTFQEFSTHRRVEHQIFHCDLCNKFYGRNSHLWKHVNRLHKGHPNITCQLCLKTSASKYHLLQHFNKTHVTKPCKQKTNDSSEQFLKQKTNDSASEHFMKQKFSGFDFQSVRQSFLRQELEERKFQSDENNSDDEIYGKTDLSNEEEENSNELVETSAITSQIKHEPTSFSPPKEIDASSNLYTNIITNYTPPQNEGKYKCPKCYKGFHKKLLLKKHKKNCRPRLQKDLLTRCKTCSRIFKDRQSLTKHLINYHSEYACEICGQKVQSKCEIVSHIRFLHPNCRLFCHCGNILRSQADLNEHMSDHRNSFVCQFCGDILPTKIKLKMHILSLHRKILSLSCGICLKLFETQHILRDHVRYVHKDQLLPMTSCTVCGKNYGSKWKAFDHINKSHGRIFKACKVCLEIFNTDDQLRIHFENFHANHISSNSSNNKNIGGQHTNSYEPTTSGLSNNKKESESDFERNENNDKMSSSDLSNEEDGILDNYNSQQMEQSFSEAEDLSRSKVLQDSLETLTRENKISLLEKRLLGIKKPPSSGEMNNVFANEKSPSKSKSSYSTVNQAVVHKKPKADSLDFSKTSKEKKSKSQENLNLLSVKRDPEGSDLDQSFNQNPLQNSSKRTVYVNSNDPSLCEICFKTWPAKKHLWQHYIRCHKTVAATVCGICLKTNENYKTLQAHLVDNHPTLLHGQGFGSNFICRICGRYHNASSKLKLHMAIHENFDWSILDGNADDEQATKKAKQSTNGFPSDDYLQVYGKNDKRSDINYESLIEQVECSSNSDNDSDAEDSNKNAMQEAINSSSDEDSDDMLSEDEVEKFTPNGEQSLEDAKKQVDENSELKMQFSSSESEDSSDSNQSLSDNEADMMETAAQMKSSTEDESSQYSQNSDQSDVNCKSNNMDSQSNQDAENSNIFVRKPEELDFAIRSISYEQVAVKQEQIREDVCEIQSHILNPHELQSAVDSIL